VSDGSLNEDFGEVLANGLKSFVRIRWTGDEYFISFK